MTTITIREAAREDIPALLPLLRQLDSPDDPLLTLQDAEALFDHIHQNPGHTLYIAQNDDGAAVGTFAFVIIQHLSHHGARSAVLEDVVVDSTLRGQGIGRQMMQKAAELGREAGCYKLMLSSGAKRLEAHHFYESLGFQNHGKSFLLDLDGDSKRSKAAQ